MGGAWWNAFGAIPTANCIAAYLPKGAANLAASYTNLVTPGTYNAAPGTAPDWDATNGWKFSLTQYLLTGITPISNQNWSMIARFTNRTTGINDRAIAGTYFNGGSFPGFVLWFGNPSTKRTYWNGSNVVVTASDTSGVMAVAGNQGYWNGIADGAAIGANSATLYNLTIGAAMRQSSSVQNFLAVYIQAFAVYNAPLSSTNIATLTTAINAL